MTLPASFLDEVRDRTRLSALIQRDVKLQRAGAEMKGCCPFHQEKTASFYVNDAKGFYHCFGCSAHGDAIRWMTDHRGLPFIEAVRELADAAGLEMPAQTAQSRSEDDHRARALEIMARAERFYVDKLMAQSATREKNQVIERLNDRNIGPAQRAMFNIGLAGPGGRGTAPELVTRLRDVDPGLLVSLGLAKLDEDGRAYDFFRNRIIIPIHDARGRCIGFGGRILGDGQPKFLNSPDTLLFDKGRTLFNLHRAAPAARRKGRLVIVEGYFDVMAFCRAGIDEVVAPNGTALTTDQLETAWRTAPALILCFDGDKAGRAAARRAALLALSRIAPGRSISFSFPPGGGDPDDLERQSGSEALSELVATPFSLEDVIWEHIMLSNEHLSGADQAGAIRAQIEQLCRSISDPNLATAYFSGLRSRIGKACPAKPRQSAGDRPLSAGDAIESAIVAGLLRHPGLVSDQVEHIAALKWRVDRNRAVISALIDAAIADRLDEKTLWAGLERAGLADAARAARRDAIAGFSFTRAGPDQRTRAELIAALDRMAG